MTKALQFMQVRSLSFNNFNDLLLGHEFDKKLFKKRVQHGIFGLIKINKDGSMYFIKEASKQGHVFDEREGLRVKDVEKALDDVWKFIFCISEHDSRKIYSTYWSRPKRPQFFN